MGIINIFKGKLTSRIVELNSKIKELESELNILNEYIQSYINSSSCLIFGNKKDRRVGKIKLPIIQTIIKDIDLNEIFGENNDINTIRQINNVLTKIKSYIEQIKKEIEILQNYICNLDNKEQKEPILFIEDFFKIITDFFEKPEEVSKVLGTIIAYNSDIKNNKMPGIAIIRQLSKYYKKDGSFKENTDYEKYKELMQQLLLNNNFLDEKQVNDYIDKFIELLKQKTKTKKMEPKREENPSTNGGCLSDTDWSIISYFCNLISKSKEYEHVEIKTIIKELQFLISDKEEITDESFKEYYEEEIESLMAKLRVEYTSYKPIEEPSNHEKNKFIFLLDEKGNTLIENDMKAFEKNQKKWIDTIFSRISQIKIDEKLTPILPLNKETPVFYEEYKTVFVAFTKLPDGNYLIIGAGKSSNDFQMLHNRAKKYSNQISRIKKMSSQNFSELLAEHSVYYQNLLPNDQKEQQQRLSA